MPSPDATCTPPDRQAEEIARAFGQVLAAALGVPFDQLEAAARIAQGPTAIDSALSLAPGSVNAAAQGLSAVARAWHLSRGGAAE